MYDIDHEQDDNNVKEKCIGEDSSVLSNGSTGCNDVRQQI